MLPKPCLHSLVVESGFRHGSSKCWHLLSNYIPFQDRSRADAITLGLGPHFGNSEGARKELDN